MPLRLTKIISQNQVQKKLESTVVCMGRKDGIGNDRFFLPYNTSLLQTFRKKKYKSEINLHGDAFSVFLFPERKKSDRNRNSRKVSKNSRIVVFRIGAVWNNKIIQGKREVL